jgi:hypothetical protein
MSRRAALLAGAAPLRLGGAAQGAHRTAPSNTSPPTISGSATVGGTLTASSGSWSGSSPMSFSYRWQRCNSGGGKCSNLNATAQTYKPVKGDIGHTLRVSVTASNSDGSANAVSAPTTVVTDGSPVEHIAADDHRNHQAGRPSPRPPEPGAVGGRSRSPTSGAAATLRAENAATRPPARRGSSARRTSATRSASRSARETRTAPRPRPLRRPPSSHRRARCRPPRRLR